MAATGSASAPESSQDSAGSGLAGQVGDQSSGPTPDGSRDQRRVGGMPRGFPESTSTTAPGRSSRCSPEPNGTATRSMDAAASMRSTTLDKSELIPAAANRQPGGASSAATPASLHFKDRPATAKHQCLTRDPLRSAALRRRPEFVDPRRFALCRHPAWTLLALSTTSLQPGPRCPTTDLLDVLLDALRLAFGLLSASCLTWGSSPSLSPPASQCRSRRHLLAVPGWTVPHSYPVSVSLNSNSDQAL